MRTEHRGGRRAPRIAASTFVLLTAAVMTACSPSTPEDSMTAQDLYNSFVSTVEDAAAQLDVTGWQPRRPVEVQPCDGDDQGRFVYWYAAPVPPAAHDRAADVAAVSRFWSARGLDVRTTSGSNPAVYAQSADITSVSFTTGPGSYIVSGTTRCVPGASAARAAASTAPSSTTPAPS